MGKRFNIKSQVPIVPSVIRASAKLVFGFAELRPVSYIKGEKDGKFFIQYLDRCLSSDIYRVSIWRYLLS